MIKVEPKAVTLAEVLVVVVIIAILGSIAYPIVIKAMERSRQAEAIVILNDMRNAQYRYYEEHGEFMEGHAYHEPGVSYWWDESYGDTEYFSQWMFKREDDHLARAQRQYGPTMRHPWGHYFLYIDENGEIEKEIDEGFADPPDPP